jgi:hypothetical protein
MNMTYESHKETVDWTSSLVLAAALGLALSSYGQAPMAGSGTGGQGVPPATQPPPDVPADWLSQVQANIMRSEYNLSRQKNPFGGAEQAWQAPNRAMGWRVWFMPEGLRVVERTNSISRFDWRMELSGYGGSGDVQPVQPATLRAENNQMTYERESVLVRYENMPEGLIQSLVIQRSEVGDQSSEGGSQGAEVWFAFPGDVKARVRDDGAMVDFVAPGGMPVATMGNGRASDAAGRELAVSLSGGGNELALSVQAEGVEFPIRIRNEISRMTPMTDEMEGVP